jgi:competence protein ComEC
MKTSIITLTEKVYHKKTRIFVVIYAVISCVFSYSIFSTFDKNEKLDGSQFKNSISFLNVGQGDATLIQTSEGHRMLIDAGNIDGIVVDEIRKKIPWYDRRLDLAMGTHADQDHVGGFTKILKSFSVGQFLFSNIHTTKSVEKILFDRLREAHVSTSTISRGAKIVFGNSGVSLNILYPTKIMKIKSDKDTNLFSIVAVATIPLAEGVKKIMLTGDAPQSVEHLLVKNQENLKSDILKAGHHGSRTSTGAEFLNVVSPSISIISAGKNNRYGHPHAEVLEIMKKSNIKILETSKNGTIDFR